jgi:hypothetical protein
MPSQERYAVSFRRHSTVLPQYRTCARYGYGGVQKAELAPGKSQSSSAAAASVNMDPTCELTGATVVAVDTSAAKLKADALGADESFANDHTVTR